MKAIIFDFDGTLTKSEKGENCWQRVWTEIDDLETDRKYYTMHKNKEIDDVQWCKLVFDRYVEKNVNAQTFKAAADKTLLLQGAAQTLKELSEKGIKVFILSGGIRQVIDLVIARENLGDYITSIETYDMVLDDKGELFDFKSPAHNLESKNEFIEFVKNSYGFKAQEILFVGNGANDQDAYKSGVVTLCVNPDGADHTNKKYWTYVIERCEDLTQILEYINPKN